MTSRLTEAHAMASSWASDVVGEVVAAGGQAAGPVTVDMGAQDGLAEAARPAVDQNLRRGAVEPQAAKASSSSTVSTLWSSAK